MHCTLCHWSQLCESVCLCGTAHASSACRFAENGLLAEAGWYRRKLDSFEDQLATTVRKYCVYKLSYSICMACARVGVL